MRVFSEFKGLPHRMQFVRNVKGINFINDSKATNPLSTIWALKNIKSKVILICGGKDKGLDYSAIIPYLKMVKKINLFGESCSLIRETLATNTDIAISMFADLEETVVASFKEATPGDTVLFSPMCASFDMFRNYIERGNKFIEIVSSL
jgi:UDP-N-acetylmuramoylalanine--D-glutamate ligase